MINKFKLLSIAFSALVLSLGACSSGGTVTPSSSQPDSSQPASSSSESSSTSVHQHTFSDKWTYDEEAHWHESTCGHMVKIDKDLHTFSEWKETTPPESEKDGELTRTCTVCDYAEHKRIPQVGTPEKLSFIKSTDETYYSVKAKDTDIEGRVAIPELYEGLPVKELYVTYDENGRRTGAFEDCLKVEYVFVPDTITSISVYSFRDCTGLKNVSLPNTLETIGRRAFDSCESLENIKIPNSVTTIDYCAFESCESLTSIRIPNQVTTISEGLFEDCYKLKTVTLPNGITHIYEDAFRGCSSLETINLPASTEHIGSFAFSECSSLKLNKYENGLYLGKEGNPYFAFIRTSDSSKNTYNINSNCEYICEGAFSGCDNLESITIPSSVISIDYYAFNCDNLKNFVFENGSKLAYFGNYVFDMYGSYKQVICNEVNNGLYLGSEENPCLILMGIKDKSATTFSIDNGCKFINQDACRWFNSLTSITIPDGVISIGRNAFQYCGGLTTVNLGSGVDTIQYNTFEECTSLTTIAIPEGVKTIQMEAFYNCSSLTTATLPKSIEAIKSFVFDGCVALTTINYAGTKAEWEKVDTPDSNKWGDDIPATVIHCSDGDVAL